eukprot:33145-Eustigmatos_ZCMA.PRE.1
MAPYIARLDRIRKGIDRYRRRDLAARLEAFQRFETDAKCAGFYRATRLTMLDTPSKWGTMWRG